ncbi:hypothetical protein [Corallincola holothuriorum]|nr:hypothetical protein [Corallincola holothuriorum]
MYRKYGTPKALRGVSFVAGAWMHKSDDVQEVRYATDKWQPIHFVGCTNV